MTLFELVPEFAEELCALRVAGRASNTTSSMPIIGCPAKWRSTCGRIWEAPFVLMFHTTADMKNAVLGGGDQRVDAAQRTERELIDRPTASSPPTRTSAPTWFGGRAPTKTRSARFRPVSTSSSFRRCDWHEVSAPRSDGRSRSAIVIFVGRIDPIKGIDTLVDAMPLVQEPDVHVVLIGGDLDDERAAGRTTWPTVRDRVTSLWNGSRVRFLGAQPQDLLPLYYSAADVVAVPSRYESFGLVAVEAMATGTPVVASAWAG